MKYLKKFETMLEFMDQMEFINNCIEIFGEDNKLEINEYLGESFIINVAIVRSEFHSDVYNKTIKSKNTYVYYKVKLKKDNDYSTNVTDILVNKSEEFVDGIEKLLQDKFSSYEFQKDFLTKFPNRYKDLEFVGYNEDIKKEFEHLFNADEMGLL